ncbi:MAG: hypothetical protein ABIT71_09210 [Vicinamibacteraceae bacterium]
MRPAWTVSGPFPGRLSLSIIVVHADPARRRPTLMPNIPTEPIGSIPRPAHLIEAVAANDQDPALEALYEEAVRDTIEQRKFHNFWTY